MTVVEDQADDDQLIMIIRHAEKPDPSGSVQGTTSEGDPDKRSLTVRGWLRAGALVGLFAPARGGPPAGLRRPDTVYASSYEGGRSRRSVQTVEPLADRLGLHVVRRYTAGDEAPLAEELAQRPGATVVSWHHTSIPKIARQLGEVTPLPPPAWPSDRFDVVWTFTREGPGWRFAQVPQLLLPGDLPHPIIDSAAAETP